MEVLYVWQEPKLYVTGSSSEVNDIESPDPKKYLLFASATYVDCELGPGDCLYIPALWHHNVLSHDFSISVNVFWRDLPADAYPRKDLYGNRDPIATEAAAASVDCAVAALRTLPPYYRRFYGARCVRQLQQGYEQPRAM